MRMLPSQDGLSRLESVEGHPAEGRGGRHVRVGNVDAQTPGWGKIQLSCGHLFTSHCGSYFMLTCHELFWSIFQIIPLSFFFYSTTQPLKVVIPQIISGIMLKKESNESTIPATVFCNSS